MSAPTNLIVAYLSRPNRSDKEAFLTAFFAKVRGTTELATNQHEWALISSLFNQLAGLAEHLILNAQFFILLAGSYSLQRCADLSFKDPKERQFYHKKWLPILTKTTVVLRTASSEELEQAYKNYVRLMIQCWELKVAFFEDLDKITVIDLVTLNLPQIEAPSGRPLL